MSIVVRSMGDLMTSEDDRETHWLLEDLLPQKGISCLVAPPKTGKTTLARQIALAVTRGDDVLGRKTEKGVVLYLGFEEEYSQVRAHFTRMGVTQADYDTMHISCERKPEGFDIDFDALRDLIGASGAAFAIIDTMIDFLQCNVTANGKIKTRLARLARLSKDTSCHIMLVHHANKEKIDLTRIDAPRKVQGSVTVFGGVDVLIMMSQDDGGVTSIRSWHRYGEPIPCTSMTFDKSKGTLTLAGDYEPFEKRDCEEQIQELLAFGPCPELKLRQAIKHNSFLVGKVLREAVERGEVTRTGEGVRGDPYTYALVSTGPTGASVGKTRIPTGGRGS